MPTASDTKKTTGDVLIVIGDASETVETLCAYFRLEEAGFQPHVIAAGKETAPNGFA